MNRIKTDEQRIADYNAVVALRAKEPNTRLTDLCAKVGIGTNTLYTTIERFDLESVPLVIPKRHGRRYSKKICLELHAKAMKLRKEEPALDKDSIMKTIGISTVKFLQIVKQYDLEELPRSITKKGVPRKKYEFEKPVVALEICPKLYAMAFRAVGGFNHGMEI